MKIKIKRLKVFFSCNRFFQSLKRHNYVTPTSYLELIAAFRKLLTQKQDSVMKAKRKYVNGLDQLAFAESQVKWAELELKIQNGW